MTFTISTKNDERKFQVEGESYEQAANLGGRKLNSRMGWSNRFHVLRTTGTRGKSGFFQGYMPGGGADSNSVGPAFHVFRGVR